MGRCELCGSKQTPAYNCNYCSLQLCSDHRLPENHNCAGLRTSSESGDTGHFESEGPTTIGQTSNLTERESSETPTPEPTEVGENLPGKATEPSKESSPPVQTKTNDSDDKKYGYEAKKQRQSEQGGILATISSILGTIILAPFTLLNYLWNILQRTIKYPARILFSWQTLVALFVIGTVILAVGIGVGGVSELLTDGAESGAAALSSLSDDGVDKEQIEQEIHEQINKQRERRGLEPLAYNSELATIARGHSEDMAGQGYFAHTEPDGDDFTDRYAAAGYECRVDAGGNKYLTGGENIAYTYADTNIKQSDGTTADYNNNETAIAEGVVDGWMNSQGHRENILTAEFQREGIGVGVTEEDGNTKILVTQNFC